MTTLYAGADVRFVSVAELGGLWRENMLFNINSPEDYETALAASANLLKHKKMEGVNENELQNHEEKRELHL
jgi:hypothetical protein